MSDCTFTSNIGAEGGGVYWTGRKATLINSTFINNTAKTHNGGGLHLSAINSLLTDCIFIDNFAREVGGAIYWSGANGNIICSNFINNRVISRGGGIFWDNTNGIISNSTFSNNKADWGGAIFLNRNNCTLTGCTFTNNNDNNAAGAIYWITVGYMNNCNFNSKWIQSNGIRANNNLTINGGKGIVNIVTNHTISGISIVVLNNETYYYPPNTNINFTDNRMIRD